MGMNVLKECLKKKERETIKTKNIQERREYLTRNRYSQAGIDQIRERNVNVVKTLKNKEVRKQNKEGKIQ